MLVGIKQYNLRITVPVCMLHGLKDDIAWPATAKSLYDRISSVQKRLVHYNNGYHELFTDTEAEKYKRDVLTFLGEVLNKDPPVLGTVSLTLGTLKKTIDIVHVHKVGTTRRYILLAVISLLYLKGLYL